MEKYAIIIVDLLTQ